MSEYMAPLARLGAPDSPLDTARRVWSEYVTPVPSLAAELLGLEGVTVVQRVLALLVCHEIVLVATSYLPTEVVDDSTRHDRQWQHGDIEALALTGYPVASELLEQRACPATPGEVAVFGMDSEAPVTVLSRRYEVEAGRHRLTAGVILVAPGDRLVLRSGPELWDDKPPTILLVLPDGRCADDDQQDDLLE